MPFSLPTAKADMIDTEGMKPWEVCALCHSLNGISVMAKFPKLAGQRTPYIIKQFQDFHTSKRINDGGQMQAITTEIDMKNLDAIADYFASLPAPPPETITEPDEKTKAALDLGEKIFNKGTEKTVPCVTCHQNDKPVKLKNTQANQGFTVPWLEAQHQDYLIKQLNDFANSERTNDPDKIMQTIASKLTSDQIEAVTLYLSTTKRPEK